MTWDACHALLDHVLDVIEERRPVHAHIGDLTGAVAAMTEYPTKRWPPQGTLFAREMHHELDMVLRQSGTTRMDRFTLKVIAALDCKVKHQDALAAYAASLRDAVRAWADTHGGRLDPDTADPVATLRDALVQFQPRLAKEMLRELLRADKYAYQFVDTRGDHTLIAIREYLDGPAFDAWRPSGDAATCGAQARRHPERDTWYRDDVDA